MPFQSSNRQPSSLKKSPPWPSSLPHLPPSSCSRSKTMASKITPFLLRSGVRCAARVARPQARAFSITASRPSDTLQVVKSSPPEMQSGSLSQRVFNSHSAMMLRILEEPNCPSESHSQTLTSFHHRSTETQPTTTPTCRSSSTPRTRS